MTASVKISSPNITTNTTNVKGLQEATRYYLEILGNTLIRPATAKYLIKCSNQLAYITANMIDCPWLSLEKFKYKDKDRLEAIFK